MVEKPHIHVHQLEPKSKEWFEFRRNGVGSSEVGTVLGINPYETRVRLFHEKVGSVDRPQFENANTFWGTQSEPMILDVWQYWDGTTDGYYNNYRASSRFRECVPFGYYITNDKYPHLFVSPDGIMAPGSTNIITGADIDDDFGIVEAKNLSYWSTRAWESGIPPYYLMQVNAQMLICEVEYAEIAILVDGKKFNVYPIERNESLCEGLLNHVNAFWDRVEQGKSYHKVYQFAQLDNDLKGQEDAQAAIQALEPEPDETEAYQEYMKESFTKQREAVQGGVEDLVYARFYALCLAIERWCKRQKQAMRNRLLKTMHDHGAEVIDFGDHGIVSNRVPDGKTDPRFDCKIKTKPTDEHVEKMMSEVYEPYK